MQLQYAQTSIASCISHFSIHVSVGSMIDSYCVTCCSSITRTRVMASRLGEKALAWQSAAISRPVPAVAAAHSGDRFAGRPHLSLILALGTFGLRPEFR